MPSENLIAFLEIKASIDPFLWVVMIFPFGLLLIMVFSLSSLLGKKLELKS